MRLIPFQERNPMGTRDGWIFLILFAGFSVVLILSTVLIAQLETFVPSRKARPRPPDPEEDTQQQQDDEPTAA
jgi:hypothetical protein